MAALDLGLVVTLLFLKDTIQEKMLRLGSGIEIPFFLPKASSGLLKMSHLLGSGIIMGAGVVNISSETQQKQRVTTCVNTLRVRFVSCSGLNIENQYST